MIEVEYNEYKETIEENMKLIQKKHKLQEEIERQENVITELNDDNEYLTDKINSLEVENALLKSIIKEAREEIKKGIFIIPKDTDKLLEILDKVEENK